MMNWQDVMDKIIGKLAFFSILFFLLPLHADVALKIYDMNGQSLNKVGMGQPFILEVAVDNANLAISGKPEIKGLENIYMRDNGVMSVTINGQSTMKYTYKVRIDTPNVYKIGPAIVHANNKPLTSNTVTVEVSDQPVALKDDKNNGQSNVAFLRFNTNKERVVVGEKITCTLRFYYTDDVLNVSPIAHPDISGISFENPTHNKGTQNINGVDYTYFELVWDAYATEPGKKVIPAYAIDFVVRSNKTYSSPIAMFFGHGGHEQKRIYSNAGSLIVDALPPYNGTVHAIGSYTHFNAKIEPSVAREGEGMVLTLELDGDGVLHNKNNMLALQEMPQSFKYYDSKNYVAEKKNPKAKDKHFFEFIVQGLQSGDWQIPPQIFTFFDVSSRTYKTLKTLPLSIMIMPGGKQQFAAPPTSSHEKGASVALLSGSGDIRSISRIRPVSPNTPSSALPWWLMFVLMAFPVVFIILDFVRSSTWYADAFGALHKKNAFKRARIQLQRAIKNNDESAFYKIFVELFVSRLAINEQRIDIASTSDILRSRGMDETEISDWQQFFTQLTEYVFFNKQATASERRMLIEYAHRWIDRLEKLL